MATPIYDPTADIRRTNESMRQNIGEIGQALVERKKQENRVASQTAEAIQLLSEEVGEIHKEYLDSELSSLQKDFQAKIFKERKLGGSKLDVTALNEFRGKIRKTKRLVENSQRVDKLYAQGSAAIESNKYIKGQNKVEAFERLNALLSDPKNLEDYDFTLLQNEVKGIVRAHENDVDVLMDNFDIGATTTNFRDTDGLMQAAQAPHGVVLSQREGGGVDVRITDKFRNEVLRERDELGLDIPDEVAIEAALNKYDLSLKRTTMGVYDREFKENRNRAAAAKGKANEAIMDEKLPKAIADIQEVLSKGPTAATERDDEIRRMADMAVETLNLNGIPTSIVRGSQLKDKALSSILSEADMSMEEYMEENGFRSRSEAEAALSSKYGTLKDDENYLFIKGQPIPMSDRKRVMNAVVQAQQKALSDSDTGNVNLRFNQEYDSPRQNPPRNTEPQRTEQPQIKASDDLLNMFKTNN